MRFSGRSAEEQLLTDALGVVGGSHHMAHCPWVGEDLIVISSLHRKQEVSMKTLCMEGYRWDTPVCVRVCVCVCVCVECWRAGTISTVCPSPNISPVISSLGN